MHERRFGLWTSQSKPWEETLAEWKLIEQLGFDCAGIVDHFMPTTGDEEGWFQEGWTLLAALAAQVPRLRISILVTGNSYRNPALLAKQAATIDHISGGRLDLGLGAGWYEREYHAYGWDFPSPGTRVEMLDEAIQLMRSLFTQKRTTFQGKHYKLHDAPLEPKPVQEHMPIMVGAQGPRMLKLVAHRADIWNLNDSPGQMRELGEVLNRACEEVGRDPNDIRWSVFAMNRVLDREQFDSVDDFRSVLEQYLDAGASEIYFRMPETEEGREVLRAAGSIIEEYRN